MPTPKKSELDEKHEHLDEVIRTLDEISQRLEVRMSTERLREVALHEATTVYAGAVPLGESGVRVADDVVTIAERFENYLKGDNGIQNNPDGQ